MARSVTHYPWEQLAGQIVPEVLQAPKTGGDPNGGWPTVHEHVVGYLVRSVVGTPWANHLALLAAVLAARQRDVQTVKLAVQTLHARFKALFSALGLQTEEWEPGRYLPPYMQGDLLPKDGPSVRQAFLGRYNSATRQVWGWLETLPSEERARYQPFTLPVINPLLMEALSKEKELAQLQRQFRKAETEAVVPHFAMLRAEAHFRYNKLIRLRQVYREAVAQVHPDHSNLPLDLSYEEGNPPQERYHVRLWDRRCFVKAHAEQYHPDTYRRAVNGVKQFGEERNKVFLELLNVERLNGDGSALPEGFWFTELLTCGLLEERAREGNEQEVATRQNWLRQWGYAEEDAKGLAAPFSTKGTGLLSWSDGTQHDDGSNGYFMARAQRRTQGVLIPVESLCAAATFGLLALDLLTTTGMRMNELMQLRLSPDCLIRLIDDPPPGASDRSPRIRYLLRLLPKGERTETLHNYGIGKESVRLIEQTAHLLSEHYQLQVGDLLPQVAFDPTHTRSHRFKPAPYLFQYAYQHVNDTAITACIRFLMHGMIFQTSSGRAVVLKAHLLRHAFATYAVHVEGLPVDLVAKWLQQKSLEVTKYYSEMPEYMQIEQHASFVARLATQLNIREAILRSPEEIQHQAQAARKRVGTLVPVCGGDCTLVAYCPNQFDCIHCPAKSPDPDKRSQVEEKQRWAKERLGYYEQEGLVLEAEKMKQLLRACELELREMDLIIAYRKDESRYALIQIQPRTRHP